MKIVFVCTANICRSPMAEGMFRKMIEENGLEESVFCLSFGLAAKEAKAAFGKCGGRLPGNRRGYQRP